MAYDNIKILCQGYQWSDTIPLQKCNFFSSEPRTPFTPEIDLMDFVVTGGLGNLKFDMDDSENENGISSMFFVSGNITLKLTGAKEINSDFPTLKEYFEITSDVSDRHSYLVRVYHDNELLFQGTVYQDGLKEPFNNGESSEIISCLIVGFENEMKNHFSNENIVNDDDIFWLSIDNNIYVRSFQAILNINFNNPFITSYNLENEINEYYVARHPRFVKNDTVGLWHNRQGYERLKWNNTKWNWFISTLNCKGWMFFIYKNTLYIKNRSSYSAPLTDIEFSELTNYDLGKRKPNDTFDYIMLIDGAYYGGDNAFFGNPAIPGINNERPFKGERPVILTAKKQLHKNTAHFSGVNGSNGSGYSLISSTDYRFSKYRSENDSSFSMYNIFHIGSGLNFGAEIIEIEQSKILRLNGGSSSNNWWRVELSQGLDSAFDKNANFPPTNPNQMEFTGCAGSALIKRNPGNPNLMLQNYQDYVNSALFVNNYAKYLDAKSTIFLTGEMNGIQKNPLQDFRFINSGDSFFDNARWSINSLEIDLENEKTIYDLQKKRITV